MPMDALTLRPEIDEPSLRLQRAYAGHVLTLRGSLPDADAARVPDVDLLHLAVPADGLVDVGQTVRVHERVPTPPVAAFLGTLPVSIDAQRNVDDYSYSFRITIPEGIKAEPTELQLRWPSRTIRAAPRLRLRQAAAVASFELLDREGAPEQWIRIGRFEVQPVEVEFGDARAETFRWRGGVLEAVVPYVDQPCLVRVTTQDGRTRRSEQFFVPESDDYGEDWVTVPDLDSCRVAVVSEVHVANGEGVREGDPLVTLDTDHASLPIEAPRTGTVWDLRVEVGARVVQGAPLLRIEAAPVAA